MAVKQQASELATALKLDMAEYSQPSVKGLVTFDLEWWRRRRAPHREKPIASFG